MCLAIPVKIVAPLDGPDSMVLVEGPQGREKVCAALVEDDGQNATDLPGRWAVVHSGFIISLLEEADACSRLAFFAAMDGQPVPDAGLTPDVEVGLTQQRFREDAS